MPLKPEEYALVTKLKELEEENSALRQQLKQSEDEQKQTTVDNEFLESLLVNIAILDRRLKELDKEREMVQNLKDITYAFALGIDEDEDEEECDCDDCDCYDECGYCDSDDLDFDDFDLPWGVEKETEKTITSQTEEEPLSSEEKKPFSPKTASKSHPLILLVRLLDEIITDNQDTQK